MLSTFYLKGAVLDLDVIEQGCIAYYAVGSLGF